MNNRLHNEMTPEEAQQFVEYEFTYYGKHHSGTCTLKELMPRLMALYLTLCGPDESWLDIKQSLKVRTVMPRIGTGLN